MSILINPGSRISAPGEGWTNTFEQARKYAQRWYDGMLEEGIQDVVMLDEVEPVEGRWRFKFQHTVTGKAVDFETHGIDNLEAYEAQYIFTPRVYRNGSSCSTPGLTDWAREGYEPVQTWRETP